jgi:phosphodiesterase/alkaline phosphatase D-like protein
MGGLSVNKLLLKLPIAAAAGGLLCASPTFAQSLPGVPPPAPRAQSVTITAGPTLEIAHDDTAILEWVTNNPGGDDNHLAVAQYGTDPNALTQTAKSPIRLNQRHSTTLFRVRIGGLQPQTTYYYKVTSMGADGTSDPVQSDVGQFTTPAAGQRITNALLPHD